MKKSKVLSMVVVACLISLFVFASTGGAVQTEPATLNYQGTLTDNLGNPLTGSQNITIGLYKASTGGTPFWQDTYTINLTNGRFSVVLGSDVNPLSSQFSQFNGVTYVGVQVGSDPEMTPRQKLTSVPYALNAQNGNKVGDIVASFLTEAAFQSQRDTTWVLAQGQSVAGSKFQQLTGLSNVPDLRGIFLRGKDNGRGADQNGDLALGTYTPSKVGPHAHNISQTPHKHSYGGYLFGADWDNPDQPTLTPGDYSNFATNGYGANAIITILSEGDSITSESSPKAVTVNYFVKIN